MQYPSIETYPNPIVVSPDGSSVIYFRQTRETLIDSEIYLRLLRSAEHSFRRSAFYKDYKYNIMSMGINMDQRRPAINSEMADIELHHNFITLEFMTIMIAETMLNKYGYVDSILLRAALEEEHRNNRICGIMLTTTEHQAHHSNPSDFISIKQCFGNPFEFIDRYISGMTLDISFKLLLHLKQEEQYGGSYDANQIRCRDQILKWQTNFNY